MEFKKLVNQLKALNLPKEKYVVVGSGAMAARKIREAKDFDVLVTKDLWDELADKYEVVMVGNFENINLGDIQILGPGSMYRNPKISSLEEMLTSAYLVDSHRFLDLQLVRKFKMREGRGKDLRDIKLIDSFLSKVFDTLTQIKKARYAR